MLQMVVVVGGETLHLGSGPCRRSAGGMIQTPVLVEPHPQALPSVESRPAVDKEGQVRHHHLFWCWRFRGGGGGRGGRG